jgi:hypothetical protein
VSSEPRAVLCPTETGCGGTEPEAHHHGLGQALEGFRRIKPMESGVVGLPKDSKPTATCVRRVHWWMNVSASAVRLNRLLARICLGLRLMEANADESIYIHISHMSATLQLIGSLRLLWGSSHRQAANEECRELKTCSLQLFLDWINCEMYQDTTVCMV